MADERRLTMREGGWRCGTVDVGWRWWLFVGVGCAVGVRLSEYRLVSSSDEVTPNPVTQRGSGVCLCCLCVKLRRKATFSSFFGWDGALWATRSDVRSDRCA